MSEKQGGFFKGRRGARRRRAEQDLAAPGAAVGAGAPVADAPAAQDEAPTHSAADLLLPDGQEEAVFVFCRELLRAPTADEAAADTLLAYRQLIAADDQDSADGPNPELLLAITRRMAAVSMPDRGSPAERRMAVSASLGTEIQCSCRETAVLLTARANGDIEPRGAAALSNHLAACPECRALDAHFERAEREFLDTIASAAPVEEEAPEAEAEAVVEEPAVEAEAVVEEPAVEAEAVVEEPAAVEEPTAGEGTMPAEGPADGEDVAVSEEGESQPQPEAETGPEEVPASGVRHASVLVGLVVLGALGVAAALLAITGGA